MSAQKAKIILTLDEAMRRDLLFFNNPVLIQGLALTPVIAAAVSLRNGFILSIAAFILIIPTRLIGDLLIGHVAKNLRTMLYAIVSAVCYIPALYVLGLLFKTDVAGPGIYLPMLIVDGVVLSRSEIPAREGVLRALRNGFFTALGTSFVLILVGTVRELLAKGTVVIGKASSNAAAASGGGVLSIASTVAGGLILVALLSALVQWSGTAFKRARMGGIKTDE